MRELDGGYEWLRITDNGTSKGPLVTGKRQKEIKPANHVAFSREIPARYLAHNLGFFPDFFNCNAYEFGRQNPSGGDAWSSEKEE